MTAAYRRASLLSTKGRAVLTCALCTALALATASLLQSPTDGVTGVLSLDVVDDRLLSSPRHNSFYRVPWGFRASENQSDRFLPLTYGDHRARAAPLKTECFDRIYRRVFELPEVSELRYLASLVDEVDSVVHLAYRPGAVAAALIRGVARYVAVTSTAPWSSAAAVVRPPSRNVSEFTFVDADVRSDAARDRLAAEAAIEAAEQLAMNESTDDTEAASLHGVATFDDPSLLTTPDRTARRPRSEERSRTTATLDSLPWISMERVADIEATVRSYRSCWGAARGTPPLEEHFVSTVRDGADSRRTSAPMDFAGERAQANVVHLQVDPARLFRDDALWSREVVRDGATQSGQRTAHGSTSPRAPPLVDMVILERTMDAMQTFTTQDWQRLADRVLRRLVLLDTHGVTCAPPVPDRNRTGVDDGDERSSLVRFLHASGGQWEEELGFAHGGGMIVLRRIRRGTVSQDAMSKEAGGGTSSSTTTSGDDEQDPMYVDWGLPVQGDVEAADLSSTHSVSKEPPEWVKQRAAHHDAAVPLDERTRYPLDAPVFRPSNKSPRLFTTVASIARFMVLRKRRSTPPLVYSDYSPMATYVHFATAFFDMSPQLTLFGCSPLLSIRLMRLLFLQRRLPDTSFAMFVESAAEMSGCPIPPKSEGLTDISKEQYSAASARFRVPPANAAIVLTTFLRRFPGLTIESLRADTIVLVGTTAYPPLRSQLALDAFEVSSVFYAGIGMAVLRRRPLPFDSRAQAAWRGVARAPATGKEPAMSVLGVPRPQLPDEYDHFIYRRRMLHRILPARPGTTMTSLEWDTYREALRRDGGAPAGMWLARINAQEPCARNFVRKVVPLVAESVGGQQRHGDSGVKARGALPVRLLCVSYTVTPRHGRAVAQFQTWGRECDRFLVFTNASKADSGRREREAPGVNSSESQVPLAAFRHAAGEYMLPWSADAYDEPAADAPRATGHDSARRLTVVPIRVPHGDVYDNVWRKMQVIRKLLVGWKHLRHYDYVVFGGDDYYLYVDNLRRHLLTDARIGDAARDGRPLYIGLQLTDHGHTSTHFMQGGAYVLNRPALFWVQSTPECNTNVSSSLEDQLIGKCMSQSHRVKTFHARTVQKSDAKTPVAVSGPALLGHEHPTVTFADAKDEFGEPLFNMLNPELAAADTMEHGPHVRDEFRSWRRGPNVASMSGTAWRLYPEADYIPPQLGLNVQSYRGVSMHYISADGMRLLHATGSRRNHGTRNREE